MNKFSFNGVKPKFYFGEDKVKKIYLGDLLVYSLDDEKAFVYASTNTLKLEYANGSVAFINTKKKSVQAILKQATIFMIQGSSTTPDVLKGLNGDICIRIAGRKHASGSTLNMTVLDDFKIYDHSDPEVISLFDPSNPIYDEAIGNILMFVLPSKNNTKTIKNNHNWYGDNIECDYTV